MKGAVDQSIVRIAYIWLVPLLLVLAAHGICEAEASHYGSSPSDPMTATTILRREIILRDAGVRHRHHHLADGPCFAVATTTADLLLERCSICRGGSDRPIANKGVDSTALLPSRKVFRRKGGRLSIDLGIPKSTATTDPASDDESTAFALPWIRNKANSVENTNTSQQAGNTKDDGDGDPSITATTEIALDAFAIIRLAIHLGGVAQAAFGAFAATLKMMGPMIMAQKCFEWASVGPRGYRQYNPSKRIDEPMGALKKYGIAEGLRALGRVAIRLLGMHLFGMFCTWALSTSPCATLPEPLCGYWYALVWTLGVKSVAHANEVLFTHCIGLFEIRPERNYFPLLPPTRYFQIPSPTVRWMYLFFGLVDNVLKVYYDEESMSSQVIGPLFPSTWPPLQVLTMVLVVRVIQKSLPESPKAFLLGFCIHNAVYVEWYRVFLKERRVALGAILSLAFLLATINFIYAAAIIDRVAGGLLLPIGLASLISTWMNFVLCGREFSSKRPSERIRYIRIE